jgi:hypothetical protein
MEGPGRLTMANVKGVVLIARRDFVLEKYGEEGWGRVLQAMDGEHRSVLEKELLSFSWYPFETNTVLDDLICRTLASGDPAIYREMGRYSAEKNLKSVHSTFVRGEGPHGLLRSAAPILHVYYDEGTRTYRRTGETSCVLTTTGGRCYSRSDCETNLGWFERAIEICGGSNVEVREPACRVSGAPSCEYHLSWK